MRAINYYDLYTKGLISLTEGYAKTTELVLKLHLDLNPDCDDLEEALLNHMLELDDHKSIREFYEDQQDLFAQKIAHNFMLANDYAYREGFYEKAKPKPFE